MTSDSPATGDDARQVVDDLEERISADAADGSDERGTGDTGDTDTGDTGDTDTGDTGGTGTAAGDGATGAQDDVSRDVPGSAEPPD